MLFSRKENIFQCLVAFQNIFWKIFSGVWFYSWKCSKKPNFIMFLTFSCIFSASKQTYHQLQQNPNSSKPKFLIPNKKKKFIKSEINLKSENNKTRTTHATTTTRKSEIKESKWIDTRSTQRRINPEQADRWRMGLTISGFAIWGMGSTDELDDLRNGFAIWRFLGSRSDKWVRNLTIWALLDERARSWVFWVHRSSWMWIDLAFTDAGCWCDLSFVLSLSLSFSRSLSLLRVTRKWFEGKMKV